MERSCCELDADGGLGLEAELVAGESGEEVGLADAGVADEHHLEEVVVLLLGAPTRHSSLSLFEWRVSWRRKRDLLYKVTRHSPAVLLPAYSYLCKRKPLLGICVA
jgi:hypothetical protein